MANAAKSANQEYWRPPNPSVVSISDPDADETTCPHCGMRFLIGARFCYICGVSREPRLFKTPETESEVKASLLGRRFGLSVPSLLFLVSGLTCGVVAALLGFFYKTETLVDWQAIQVWRIEWLLAAAVALLAAIALKKPTHTS